MGSTFHSLHYHIVFSTKSRHSWIRPTWRPQLHEYMGGTVKGLGGVPETIGGVDDHVHLLVGLRTTDVIADVVRELKKASSAWATDNHEPSFSWQDGYSVFSVSWTHLSAVRRYIDCQESHHARVSYADELRRILERNGVKYEEKYLL